MCLGLDSLPVFLTYHASIQTKRAELSLFLRTTKYILGTPSSPAGNHNITAVPRFIFENFRVCRHYIVVSHPAKNDCSESSQATTTSSECQMVNSGWYGVRVRAKSESQVSNALSARGFKAFLPTQHVRRRWSDRVKNVEVPLFPGYLFCRFRPEERVRVLEAPAVIQIVGIGATPIPISDSEIQDIRTMVDSHLTLTPWPYLHTGQHVHIERGPLAGIDGIVTQAQDGNSRVVVSIALLQRSIATEIERDWVA